MIDQNNLVEIINNSLPVLITSLATSPVFIKLIGSVENVIKTLYAPKLTFKNGKAEVDIELYRKGKESELLENQTFTLYEINKLKNFVHAANFAAEELQKTEFPIIDEEEIDFDWLMRFFDAVGNVSNENLQKLWGKILAGEVKQPKSCSLRTLDIIRNMSQNEAETFEKLCKLVLMSGDCYFIFSNGFLGLGNSNNDSHNYILKKGLNYSSDIIPMIECGLLSVDNALATDFKTNNVLCMNNQDISCFIIADESKDNYISIEPYFLTRSGIELYNIIQRLAEYNSDNEYALYCFRELKNTYSNLAISAHKRTSDDEFEPDDLL